jgi:hypothetical protein
MSDTIRTISVQGIIDEAIKLYPYLDGMPQSRILVKLAKIGLETMKKDLLISSNPQQSQHNAPITQQLLKEFFDFDVFTDEEHKYLEIS